MPEDPKQYLDREGYEHPDSLEPKTIHAGDEFAGQPYVHVDEDGVALVGDRKHLIAVDPKFGVLLAGPVSLSAMPDQISFAGGYYRFNPLTLSTVPSTTPTPVPVLVKDTPPLLAGNDGIGDLLSGLESSLGI
jgi:hypothetical protein